MTMTESPAPDQKSALVDAAVRRWVSDLTDLGRRNTLLYYRDLRSGTLDLEGADPAAMERLLAAKPVRLSRLFPAERRADALRRARTIHRKIREMTEERGINAGYLAIGMARWAEPATEAVTKPAAPVLLRAVTMAPTRARHDDFELLLDEEPEVNPVLLHKLNTEFGAGIDAQSIKTLVTSELFDPIPAYDRLRKLALAAEISGFAIDDRRVLGTFTYAKLPMVRDLSDAPELLRGHRVVAAVAGDPEAQAGLDRAAADPAGAPSASGPPASGSTFSPTAAGPTTDGSAAGGLAAGGRPARVPFAGDRTGAGRTGSGPTRDRPAGDPVPGGHAADGDPHDDVSVLDADSSQLAAVRAVRGGRDLVIHGPPGTGKSQTIANLIATLVAGGWRVLFVAEKRAAIDAVLGRLDGVDLGDLVLDIHDGSRDRRRIARDLDTTLRRARQTPPPDVDWLHRRLAGRRRLLSQHVAALHAKRDPWGVTAFEVQAALLGIPESARTAVRFRGETLRRLDSDTADRLRDEIREYAHIGGFAAGTDPWHGALLHTAEQAGDAHEAVTRLSSVTLPAARRRLDQAVAETGVRAPRSLPEWRALIELFEGVRTTLEVFVPEIFGHDLTAMVAATGSRDLRRTMGIKMRRRDRLRLIGQARAHWRGPGSRRPGRAKLHRRLVDAHRQQREWPAPTPPRVPAGLDELARRHAEVAAGIAALRPLIPSLEPEWLGALETTLAALAADHVTPWHLPRTHALARRFGDLGLHPLLDELTRRAASPDTAAHAFDFAWHSSVLDRIRVDDPDYAGLPGATLDELVSDFRDCDTQHLLTNQARVRRATAERLRDVQDRFPAQAQLIRKQAALRRRHMPLRRLIDQAGEVLFALKPCWAMSPLMASQVLPARRLFDVVIFDEASQVIPADAIPAIMRAGQVVVAGDSQQLPPTNFFRQIGDDDAADDTAADGTVVSFDTGFESILETLQPLLPSRRLEWHYRSRDERLVAFSNARIYGGSLTTFPGVFAGDCLRHVAVDAPAEPGQEHSVAAEVDRVVQLILEHARDRPGESLGVITMGAPHANRVDSALRGTLAAHPDLEGFFSDDSPEPFFVKNLERVQGDERDAIILTIGYGKRADGQMRYHWGPLLREGGERRLNVAITRAKRRLTLVSSFSSHDIDPARLSSEGARLLCGYLTFAESGGTRVGGPPADESELSAFEQDVCRRLAAAGIPVTPRYGIGGHRIDFAAAHPAHPERMILAIEADGPGYHRSGDPRDRDRLRQEQLERLGWAFHRIWSTNWFLDPEAEVAKIRAAHAAAVAAADRAFAPGPEPASEPAPRSVRGAAAESAAESVPGAEAAAARTPSPAPTRSPGITPVSGHAPARPRDPAVTGDVRVAGPRPRPDVVARSGATSRHAAGVTSDPVHRRLPRPQLRQALPIGEYTHDELVDVARWIESDRLLRTEEETLAEIMDALGLRRRGSRIVAAITAAIATARGSADRS